MKYPSLSVVVPVYNVEAYLKEALDSLRYQSFTDAEFIVINDGSTDGSREILNEFEDEDDRFQIFHQKNAGLSAARNAGLKKANGDIIYFFDSDDVLIEGAFQKAMYLIRTTGSQIVFFPAVIIDQFGNRENPSNPPIGLDQAAPIPGTEFIQKMISTNRYDTNVQKYFFRKSFLMNHALRFDAGYIHEDEAFMIESICLADRVTSFEEALLTKRNRPHSIMATPEGLENVKGWSHAIPRVLKFLNKENLDKKSEQLIMRRINQLAHNCIRILHRLKKSGEQLSLDNYLTEEEQKKLGFLVRVHKKSSTLYRILNGLIRTFLSKKRNHGSPANPSP